MTASTARPAEHAGVPLLVLLAALSAFAPMSTDMYLPALPTIAGELAVALGAVQGTLSVFFIGVALGQVLYGPLSDRYGRRLPLLGGVLLYSLASIGCALANDVGVLWLCRLGSALGGCAGIVIARAVVRDLYGVIDSARIYSRLMLVYGLAPILAPLIGGQLLAAFGWRSIFWTLAGFGLASLIAAWFLLPESHAGTPGAARPATVARNFAAMLRDRSFRTPAFTASFAYGTLFSYLVASPAVLIGQYGVSTTHYGWFFGANACALIAASQINARLVRTRGPARLFRRGIFAIGAVGVALALVAWTGVGGVYGISAVWLAQLAALGFVNSNGAACALANQGPRAGSASALYGALQFGVGGFASSCVATLTAWPSIGTPALAVAIVTLVFAALAVAMLLASPPVTQLPLPHRKEST